MDEFKRPFKVRFWDNEKNKYATQVEIDSYCSSITVDLYDDISSCITIEQFTGFLDIAGREIYEGDVIKEDDHDFEVPMIGSVIWNSENGWWSIDGAELLWACNYPIIIGNIHENKGLST